MPQQPEQPQSRKELVAQYEDLVRQKQAIERDVRQIGRQIAAIQGVPASEERRSSD